MGVDIWTWVWVRVLVFWCLGRVRALPWVRGFGILGVGVYGLDILSFAEWVWNKKYQLHISPPLVSTRGGVRVLVCFHLDLKQNIDHTSVAPLQVPKWSWGWGKGLGLGRFGHK